MNRIKGLEVTEYAPTVPMDIGEPREMRPKLSQLDRIEAKLDALIHALAEEEPEGTLDESDPVDPGKVQGL